MQDHNPSPGPGTSHGSQSVGQSNSGTPSPPKPSSRRGKKDLLRRAGQIELAAGIDLLALLRGAEGRKGWDAYYAAKAQLKTDNPEYRSIEEELDQIQRKKTARESARRERVAQLRHDLLSLLNSQITDEQKIALRVAVHLVWDICKPAVVARAEKQAQKAAAAEVPAFVPAAWSSRRRPATERKPSSKVSGQQPQIVRVEG